MKKNLKKLFNMLLVLIACICTGIVANAETASKTMTITSYDQSNIPISFPATFRVKKTADGKYSYCTYYAKSTPSAGVTYTRGSLITDNGLNYIMKEAYDAKNDQEFFIYQTAMWVYMVDKGMMQGPYYDLTVFKSQINSSNGTTATQIKNIVSAAKSATKNDTTAPTIKVNTTGDMFVLDNKKEYYVSTKINVTSSTGKFKVTLTSAPEGTKVEKGEKYFVIKVPANKVTSLKTTIKFKVSNSKAVYNSYYYNPSNSTYQIMANTFKTTKTANDTANLKIEKTVSIPVLKVDAEGKALSGAKLQVLNSKGTVIDGWTSTDKAHTVTGLTEGTYTLKEISAPNGYVLSNVQTKFTVDANGKVKNSSGTEVTQIKYENKKTSITISKQDITNKEELPGAHLVIKDSTGKQIIEWTSSTKRYVIKGLAAGTYTLTETIAPNGYTLSTEKITFKIDAYGTLYNSNGKKVDSIVMYNSPIKTKDLTISKRDITTNKELPGATLVVKDASGNVIDSWVSNTTDHVIKNMKEGTYTLTETIAPKGYVLSKETITFKIDKEGKLYNKDGKNIDKVIMYNEPEKVPTDVSISKQDITTSKELSGATLVVKDANGNVIDSWVSTTTAHVIKNMKEGTYTLTETIAPKGYVLSSETITFKIDSKGKLYNKDGKIIDKVIMYNTPEKTPTTVSISKQDITTGKELPGATLVVKDYDGNKIDEWVSTDTPHIIKDLKPGIYTLTETIAPNGYILSTETITFTIKEDGTATKVVMYNTPDTKEKTPDPEEVPVENTASFKTITSSLVGIAIVILGTVMVLGNTKRKEN